MKVLHLMVSGRAGGIESLLRDYVNYSNHENLFLFAWDGGPMADQIEDSGCRVIRMNQPRDGSLAVCRRILELCQQEWVAAIVVHHEAPLLRLAALAVALMTLVHLPFIILERREEKGEKRISVSP